MHRLHSTRPQGAEIPRKRCGPSSGTGPSSRRARSPMIRFPPSSQSRPLSQAERTQQVKDPWAHPPNSHTHREKEIANRTLVSGRYH
jgi:hypothetical protein